MTGLSALWLPILLSAVFVFIASSVIHMGPLWHRSDYPRVPNEDQLRDAVRPLDIPPGDYMVPRAMGSEEMKSAAFQEKIQAGPNLILTVLPREAFNMGRSLGLWFVYLLGISVFAAYMAARANPSGAEYLSVFRFATTAAFLAHAGALWPMWIWYRRDLGMTIKGTVDGLIYGLITGGVFGWLWPG